MFKISIQILQTLYIYNGEGTSGTLLGKYTGRENIPLLVSTKGSLTIRFYSDPRERDTGFELTVCCIINSPQTIYNLIKNNLCRMISCDSDYKSKQNGIDLNTGSNLESYSSTNNENQFRTKCYNNCPENTINNKLILYFKSNNEKCEQRKWL